MGNFTIIGSDGWKVQSSFLSSVIGYVRALLKDDMNKGIRKFIIRIEAIKDE